MLENLVIAVESESQIVDLGRVSGFMQKVYSSTLPYTYLTDLLNSGPRWHHLIWCCRRLFIHPCICPWTISAKWFMLDLFIKDIYTSSGANSWKLRLYVPDARRFPSLEMSTDITLPASVDKVRNNCQSSALQSLTKPS